MPPPSLLSPHPLLFKMSHDQEPKHFFSLPEFMNSTYLRKDCKSRTFLRLQIASAIRNQQFLLKFMKRLPFCSSLCQTRCNTSVNTFLLYIFMNSSQQEHKCEDLFPPSLQNSISFAPVTGLSFIALFSAPQTAALQLKVQTGWYHQQKHHLQILKRHCSYQNPDKPMAKSEQYSSSPGSLRAHQACLHFHYNQQRIYLLMNLPLWPHELLSRHHLLIRSPFIIMEIWQVMVIHSQVPDMTP